MRHLYGISLAVVGAGVALLMSGSALAQQKFTTVGTAGVTGVYYVVGGAICRLMNKDRLTSKTRCSVESTGEVAPQF